ncbi:MAG: hypothetical protein DRO36_03995 [Candidatus Hecatellales archaeon]|nr:MAG: hypothetical protein DRO36_03995 [Candidatus Hecatellales archaeon]
MSVKEELKTIVGSNHVLTETEKLKEYSKDFSFHPPRMPNYVVQPGSVKEIQEIVKLANKYLIPIIPCSSSVHFYGLTIPEEGGIILDLRRLNRILEIDKENRMVRVEPGVTWENLQTNLEKEGFRVFNPLFPHRLKSVLTSYLEREPMIIPKFEYSDPILTMEVVLPNGDLLRTGSAAAPGVPDETISDLVGPYGPGLDFYRFFQGAQGTLGIVTWVSLKMGFLPSLKKTFLITSNNLEDLIELTYNIQRLMIGNECFIVNNHNMANLASTTGNPEEIGKLREKLPQNILVLCLAGGYRRPEEKIAYEEEVLEKACSDVKLKPQTSLPPIPDLSKTPLDKLHLAWSKDPYWKFQYKGSCCDIFFITVLERVPDFLKLAYDVLEGEGYSVSDLGYYIQPLEYGRACHCEFNLPYDPNDPKEIKKISSIFEKLSERIMANGGFFSRPYGLWSRIVYEKATEYVNALRKLKSTLDPNNIMNPGKIYYL